MSLLCTCYILGFQDPWNVNANVHLPTGTNMTIIQQAYGRGPLLGTETGMDNFGTDPSWQKKKLLDSHEMGKGVDPRAAKCTMKSNKPH